jgi:hypothetical protein
MFMELSRLLLVGGLMPQNPRQSKRQLTEWR